MKSIDEFLNTPLMKQLKEMNAFHRSLIPPEVARVTEQVQKLNLHLHSSFVNDLPSTHLLNSWNDQFGGSTLSQLVQHKLLLDLPRIPKVSVVPDELLETLSLLRKHNEVLKDFEIEIDLNDGLDLEYDAEFSKTLSHLNEELQTTSSNSAVYDLLRKLPGYFWLLLIYTIKNIIVPTVAAAVIQPSIDEYLNKSQEPQRVQISTIKNIPQSSGTQTTAKNRFISGDNVRLRTEPSIKSSIIQSLNFGQAVLVIEKDKSWIKVAIPQKDGSSLEGWVFTEYTERFKD